MKLNWILFAIFTILAGIFLLGSLFITMTTNKPIYFVFGYPLSGLFLAVAYITRPKDTDK
jgi:hypothetical protein